MYGVIPRLLRYCFSGSSSCFRTCMQHIQPHSIAEIIKSRLTLVSTLSEHAP